MKKLKVTLTDRPIDVELAQYKRMFEAACSALGSIGDALGVDPEEGGAEPILAAIAELKTAQPAQDEPVGEAFLCDTCSTPFDGDYYCPKCKYHTAKKTPIYTRPQAREWVGLTDEEMHECWGDPLTPLGMKHARMIEAKLKEKNT